MSHCGDHTNANTKSSDGCGTVNVMHGCGDDNDRGNSTRQPNPAVSRWCLFFAAAPDSGNSVFYISGSGTKRFRRPEYVNVIW